MENQEQKHHERNEQLVSEFYVGFQNEVQEHLLHLLDKFSELAGKADISVSDIALCLGYSVTSTLFELIRNEGEEVLTPETAQYMEQFQKLLSGAVAEKIELLGNAEAMKEIGYHLGEPKH